MSRAAAGSADSSGSAKAPAATASAPGKIMLAGEYAVLEGADAALIAVERRAYARISHGPEHLSPFLRAVLVEIREHAGGRSETAQAAQRLIVDSHAFRAADGTKLGLGSSAAVTVAATACALGVHAAAPALSLIHRLAHAAHGHAQRKRGARGSGADIAAAVYGGLIAVRCHADPETPVLVRPLATGCASHLVYLWTGAAADTPTLVARVHQLRERAPTAYDRAIADVAGAAASVIAALRPSARAVELVEAIELGAQATAALGQAAGVALETPVHQRIATIARRHGGAAKPTGAGAGDIAVAVFADADQAAAFRAEATASALTLLDLSLAPSGVLVS